MNDLSKIGFDPFFERQLETEHAIVARISSEHRGLYHIWSAAGDGAAKLGGRLSKQCLGEAYPGVGDFVVLDAMPSPNRPARIEQVLDRRTVFVRGAAGKRTQGQVVAANVDVVFIVCGLDNDYNPRRIERYLARVYASGAMPVVVLNKVDICDAAKERLAEVQGANIGLEVIAISATEHLGLEEIRGFVQPGMTAALVGSSGAGKSTIVNGLMGDRRMDTKPVRRRDDRGCHTTTHRQMLKLSDGGILIDTPGMRELQLIDDEGIDTVFSDIEALSENCRFRDCSHQSEPGCAVKAALDSGELAEERLMNYRKMQQEAAAYELRHNAQERKKAAREWGQLYSEGKRIRRWKEGG